MRRRVSRLGTWPFRAVGVARGDARSVRRRPRRLLGRRSSWRAAREHGLEATGWRQDLDDLPNLPLPAILFWEFQHFVVLEGIGKGRYFLNDPRRGRRVVDEDAFDRGFTGVALELAPAASFRRKEPPPGVLRRLWPWVSEFRPTLLFAVLAGLLLAVPGLAAPVLLALFVDHALEASQDGWGRVLIGAMAAAAGVVYVLTWIRQRALRRLSISVAIHQADRFVGRLLRRPAEFFARRMTGDLLSRMQSIERVASVGVNQFVGVTVELTMSLAFLALMFVYDSILAALGRARRGVVRGRGAVRQPLSNRREPWPAPRAGPVDGRRSRRIAQLSRPYERPHRRTTSSPAGADIRAA